MFAKYLMHSRKKELNNMPQMGWTRIVRPEQTWLSREASSRVSRCTIWTHDIIMLHGIYHISCNMIRFMLHTIWRNEYHLTWSLSCDEKTPLRVLEFMCTWFFFLALWELSGVHGKFIMSSKGIFFWCLQKRKIFFFWPTACQCTDETYAANSRVESNPVRNLRKQTPFPSWAA